MLPGARLAATIFATTDFDDPHLSCAAAAHNATHKSAVGSCVCAAGQGARRLDPRRLVTAAPPTEDPPSLH